MNAERQHDHLDISTNGVVGIGGVDNMRNVDIGKKGTLHCIENVRRVFSFQGLESDSM